MGTLNLFFRDIPAGWLTFSLDGGCCLLRQHEGDQIDTTVFGKIRQFPSLYEVNMWLETVQQSIQEAEGSMVSSSDNVTFDGYEFSVITSLSSLEEIGDVVKTGYFSIIEQEGFITVINIFTTVMFDKALDDEKDIKTILNRMLVGVF